MHRIGGRVTNKWSDRHDYELCLLEPECPSGWKALAALSTVTVVLSIGCVRFLTLRLWGRKIPVSLSVWHGSNFARTYWYGRNTYVDEKWLILDKGLYKKLKKFNLEICRHHRHQYRPSHSSFLLLSVQLKLAYHKNWTKVTDKDETLRAY